jgi:alpha-mannosidase
MGEAGYGVALLNNCKYGYDIHGRVMRLSLLRAPGYPDPEADRGLHHFAYALLPHLGDFRTPGRVVEEAEAFNLPLAIGVGGGGGQVVAVDRPGVSVEAVKWADRGGGVVVRLCEVWGSRGRARVRVGFPFGTVTRTDLLERDVSPVASGEGVVELELRPFELVTLRFSDPS